MCHIFAVGFDSEISFYMKTILICVHLGTERTHPFSPLEGGQPVYVKSICSDIEYI